MSSDVYEGEIQAKNMKTKRRSKKKPREKKNERRKEKEKRGKRNGGEILQIRVGVVSFILKWIS